MSCGLRKGVSLHRRGALVGTPYVMGASWETTFRYEWLAVGGGRPGARKARDAGRVGAWDRGRDGDAIRDECAARSVHIETGITGASIARDSRTGHGNRSSRWPGSPGGARPAPGP